jgi:hypothetical protein
MDIGGMSPRKRLTAGAGKGVGLKCRRGFFVADIGIGLAIIGLVAVLLVTAVGRHNKAAARLADSRAAVRVAESVLISLQTGAEVPADAEATVRIERSPAAAAAGVHWEWASVTVTYRGRSAVLNGLVPAEGGTP